MVTKRSLLLERDYPTVNWVPAIAMAKSTPKA